MKTNTVIAFAATAVFSLVPLAQAHAQMSGISNPEALDDNIATAATGNAHYTKQAAAKPDATLAANPALHEHAAAPAAPAVYGSFTPYVAPVKTPAAPPAVKVASAAPSAPATLTESNTSGVVYGAYVPYRRPGEPAAEELPMVKLAEGTTLEAKLLQPISTKSTEEGSHFTATLNQDYAAEGSTVLPSGSVIHGRITRIHGGHMFGGNSAIHMQADTVSTPDGMIYKINAEVSGLDNAQISRVNEEGTIMGTRKAKDTAAMLGFTTGSTVVVGAMLGGGVGALVGLGVGVGISTVWYVKQDRQLTLPEGTPITFTLADAVGMHPVTQ